MRVLVTGGAGFIGANLVRHLLSANVEVVIIDDLSSGRLSNIDGLPVDFVESSILDQDAMSEACVGADSIIHLAARPSVPRSITDPMASHHVNATGTLAVLECARQMPNVPHIVVASSSSVYGNNHELPKSEGLVPMPASPYAVSKLAAESYALAYQHCFDMHTLALRFFNVYGPLQLADHAYAAVVPAFVKAALENRPLEIYGDGTQTRDFTFVSTVVHTLATAALTQLSSDTPINLAFGTQASLLDVINELEKIMGRPLDREHRPSRRGDVLHSRASSTVFSKFFPTIAGTPLREGLQRTLEWYSSEVRDQGETYLSA